MKNYQRPHRDGNHAEIVSRFKQWPNVSVADTAASGAGFPDLVVGICGVNILVEIKDPAQYPSDRKLSAAQKRFHETWQGWACVCETVDDVDRLVEHVRQSHARRYVDAIAPRVNGSGAA